MLGKVCDIYMIGIRFCILILTYLMYINIVTCISDYTQGFELVNRFIDHLQVETTNNYYTIADFHATDHSTLKSSQSPFTSLYLVTAVHNGYFCTIFSLDVSW
jgi:hypothetical protein